MFYLMGRSNIRFLDLGVRLGKRFMNRPSVFALNIIDYQNIILIIRQKQITRAATTHEKRIIKE